MKAKIKIKTDVFLLNLKKASCTQKEFAGAAGISATYLNNLIHNRQPVGVKLKDMLRSTFKKMFPERKDLSCDFFYIEMFKINQKKGCSRKERIARLIFSNSK